MRCVIARGVADSLEEGRDLIATHTGRADASVQERNESVEDSGHLMPGQWTKGMGIDGVNGANGRRCG